VRAAPVVLVLFVSVAVGAGPSITAAEGPGRDASGADAACAEFDRAEFDRAEIDRAEISRAEFFGQVSPDPVDPADPPAPGGPGSPEELLDLNTAEREELLALPGVDPAEVDSLLAHRRRLAGFPSLEALERVPGLPPDFVARIRPYVTVGAVSESGGVDTRVEMEWRPGTRGAPATRLTLGGRLGRAASAGLILARDAEDRVVFERKALTFTRGTRSRLLAGAFRADLPGGDLLGRPAFSTASRPRSARLLPGASRSGRNALAGIGWETSHAARRALLFAGTRRVEDEDVREALLGGWVSGGGGRSLRGIRTGGGALLALRRPGDAPAEPSGGFALEAGRERKTSSVHATLSVDLRGEPRGTWSLARDGRRHRVSLRGARSSRGFRNPGAGDFDGSRNRSLAEHALVARLGRGSPTLTLELAEVRRSPSQSALDAAAQDPEEDGEDGEESAVDRAADSIVRAGTLRLASRAGTLRAETVIEVSSRRGGSRDPGPLRTSFAARAGAGRQGLGLDVGSGIRGAGGRMSGVWLRASALAEPVPPLRVELDVLRVVSRDLPALPGSDRFLLGTPGLGGPGPALVVTRSDLAVALALRGEIGGSRFLVGAGFGPGRARRGIYQVSVEARGRAAH
jgi:hypothetical protein